MSRRTLFLDRDGIITYTVNGDAPRTSNELKIIPDIIPVIKKAKKAGFFIIVVSNQPDIALGKIDEETKNALEKRFVELVKKNKLLIDDIYYCNHHPKGVVAKYTIDCDCRKPKPGMLFQAAKDHNINLKNSFFLGDRASDVKAGKAAGVTTILYDPEGIQDKYLIELNVKPDYAIQTLSEVTDVICKQ